MTDKNQLQDYLGNLEPGLNFIFGADSTSIPMFDALCAAGIPYVSEHAVFGESAPDVCSLLGALDQWVSTHVYSGSKQVVSTCHERDHVYTRAISARYPFSTELEWDPACLEPAVEVAPSDSARSSSAQNEEED